MRTSKRLLLLLLSRKRQPLIGGWSFRSILLASGRRRRDRRITRRALQSPSMSSFKYLFSAGCKQSLIMLAGLDYNAFHYMITLFTEPYERYSPYIDDGSVQVLPTNETRRGRPRSMNSSQCLGFMLTWIRTRGWEMGFCMLFGIPFSLCSFFSRFGRRLFLRILSSDVNAAVRMPNFEEISKYMSALKKK